MSWGVIDTAGRQLRSAGPGWNVINSDGSFSALVTDLIVGEPGNEASSITINGGTYSAHLKVSDINDPHPAEFIIHRHSTTYPAALIASRSNSTGSGHSAVTNGQSLFQIYAVGHDGTDYAFSSAISFDVDGTPGSNDMPGRIGLYTSPDGSHTLAERLQIDNAGHVIIQNPSTTATLRFMEPSGGANYTEFKAQAQSADVTYTLPAADGSNTYVLQTNGSGTLSWVAPSSGGPTLGTPQNSTSGTSIDFTGIPAGTKRIVISFVGVSASGGTSPFGFQIGDSGGIETSGYLGGSEQIYSSPSGSNYTGGWFGKSSSANTWHGTATLTLVDSSTFTWVMTGVFYHSNQAAGDFIAGSKSLSAELDRVRITSNNGTDTFSAGKINILYD